MKLLNIFFPLLVFMSNIYAQEVEINKPTFYTHELIAKIIKVDTITIVNDDYLSKSNIPIDNFKVLCIRIKIISKIKGDFKKAPRIIFVELEENEHNCLYDFKEEKVYKIYAYISKYTSDAVEKKYRKKFFKLDCYHPPTFQ